MFSASILRDTILGKLVWKKCPSCEGTCFENWNEDGEDVKGGQSSDPDRTTGCCENCEGLGFVKAYLN